MKIPAAYYRGGTSKGILFHKANLPSSMEAWKPIFSRAMGGNDPYGKQMDGLGNGSSSTSKVAVVSPSEQPDCDVNYFFAQVGVSSEVVDFSGSCGNLASAAGRFAIDEGIVPVPKTSYAYHLPVRLWQENVQQQIIVNIPVCEGKAIENGDFVMDGVSGSGAEIFVDFIRPQVGDLLLPTQQTRNTITIPEFSNGLEYTAVCAGNPVIFIKACDIELSATELEVSQEHLKLLDEIRCRVAVEIGFGKSAEWVRQNQPHTPFISFVSNAQDFKTSDGRQISEKEIDLCARIISNGKLHHAFTGTGAVALATCAAVEDSTVSDLVNSVNENNGRKVALTFGHRSGKMKVGAVTSRHENGAWQVERATFSRTARRMFEGHIFIPDINLQQSNGYNL